MGRLNILSLFAGIHLSQLICILLLSLPVYGQSNRVQFQNISIEQGLSQSIVECILQDRTGFLWFGTEDGLNRYDGYTFTVYKEDPDNENSLSHDNILCLYEDGDGIIWIGTFHGGLTRFDTLTGRFTRFRHDASAGSLSSNVVYSVVRDRKGNLWVGTADGLNRFDETEQSFRVYRHQDGDPNSLSHNTIRSMCLDARGNLWIGTDGGGLCMYDGAGFVSYRASGKPDSISHDSVLEVFCDSQGILWLGTNGGGLNSLDIEENHFYVFRHKPGQPHSLSNDVVLAVYEDDKGRLWVGTNDGLNLYSRQTNRFTRYYKNGADPNSLSHNEIHSIYQDYSGVLWFGTYGGGINKLLGQDKGFNLLQADPENTNSLSHNIVWAICEQEVNILWIGTHGGGLNRLDRKSGIFRNYRHNTQDPASLSNDMVRVIFIDHAGTFWLGTNGGGICRFDSEKGTFRTYTYQADDPESLSHSQVRCIYEDSDHDLWVGTHGGGLNRFDSHSAAFVRYLSGTVPGMLNNAVVRCILEIKPHVLWVGTYGGGINVFDKHTARFSYITSQPDNPASLSNNYVFCLFRDSKNRLWVGTEGGLNYFNEQDGTFKRYTRDDGLPDNTIYGILEDDQGHLWLSTNNGLSRFNPQQESCKNYTVLDGLQSNEFNGGSFFRNPVSGEMFFGGINGLNTFFPRQIRDNPYKPPVVITSFKKLNREHIGGTPIFALQKITLSYRDYFFSFEFAALDFTIPDKNQYSYKLEGLDEQWINTDARHRVASYTTLAPGTYTFLVRGTNNDGIGKDTPTRLIIHITPPFWATWWFRLSAIAALFLTVLFLYKSHIRNVYSRTRLETELKTAHHAQMSIMPQHDPRVPGYDISGRCFPANEVGGDFFDYFWLEEGRESIGIAVGDVSGKAMKAAMTAVLSHGVLFSQSTASNSLQDLMHWLNHILYHKTEKSIFLVICLLALRRGTRELTFCNAGLPMPLLKSGGTVKPLEQKPAMPLGVQPQHQVQECHVTLVPGDVLLVFSDGLTEAWNRQREFYGTGRLAATLEALDTHSLSAAEIADRLVADIKTFSRNMEQHDDMNLVAIKVL